MTLSLFHTHMTRGHKSSSCSTMGMRGEQRWLMWWGSSTWTALLSSSRWLEFALMWLLFCRLTHTHREKSPRGEKKESSRRTRNEIEVSLSVTWVTITCVQKRSSLCVCLGRCCMNSNRWKNRTGRKIGHKKDDWLFSQLFPVLFELHAIISFLFTAPSKNVSKSNFVSSDLLTGKRESWDTIIDIRVCVQEWEKMFCLSIRWKSHSFDRDKHLVRLIKHPIPPLTSLSKSTPHKIPSQHFFFVWRLTNDTRWERDKEGEEGKMRWK